MNSPLICLYKKLFFLLLIMVIGKTEIAQAQVNPKVTVNVNRKSFPIGEQFELTLSYSYPENENIKKVPYINDTFPHFEVIDRKKADTVRNGDQLIIVQTMLVTSFDSGHWTIPPVTLATSKKTFKSDTIGIDVLTVPLSGTSYNDIKEIIEVGEKPFDWVLWGGILISVILLSVGLWYYIKKQKKQVQVVKRFDTRLTPLDQALQELEKLKQSGLLEKGEMKNYYTRAGEIFKIFLERQIGPGYMQFTTDQILVSIKDKFSEKAQLSGLAEVLRIADAVKFAKYASSAEEAVQSVNELEKSIRSLNQQKV